jgi:hypothetical protein
MVYQIVVGGPKTRFIEIKQNNKKKDRPENAKQNSCTSYNQIACL